jgi:hypothetical protein
LRSRRLQGEVTFIAGMQADASSLTAERLQGAWNNLGGVRAELHTARIAPHVVALGRQFAAPFSAPGGASAEWECGRGVDVDVVAGGGHLWVEV